MESKFVEADGVRMRWEETGEGLPVVFVHEQLGGRLP